MYASVLYMYAYVCYMYAYVFYMYAYVFYMYAYTYTHPYLSLLPLLLLVATHRINNYNYALSSHPPTPFPPHPRTLTHKPHQPPSLYPLSIPPNPPAPTCTQAPHTYTQPKPTHATHTHPHPYSSSIGQFKYFMYKHVDVKTSFSPKPIHICPHPPTRTTHNHTTHTHPH